MNLTPRIPQHVAQYGAPIGRVSWDDSKKPFTGPMYLRRIYLDSGGYDKGGAYWGIGSPLYGFAAYDDSINGFTRASNRADAKVQVLAKYPGAKLR